MPGAINNNSPAIQTTQEMVHVRRTVLHLGALDLKGQAGNPYGHRRAPTRRHWDVFVGLCASIQGPLVTDAYLAALAIEHGCELVTTDSDFARFQGLRWRHPLAV